MKTYNFVNRLCYGPNTFRNGSCTTRCNPMVVASFNEFYDSITSLTRSLRASDDAVQVRSFPRECCLSQLTVCRSFSLMLSFGACGFLSHCGGTLRENPP